MTDKLTDLNDFGIQNYMVRVSAHVIVDDKQLLDIQLADLEDKVHSELIMSLAQELTRSIIAKKIPVEILTVETMMGKKVSVEIGVVPNPMAMFADINQSLPWYNENTLVKVRDIILRAAERDSNIADEAIEELQNAGILFRERQA